MNTLFKPEEISTLCLGIQGENKAKIIQIDVSDWLEEYPTATINILVTRPNETTPYIANTSVSNGVFSWLITDSDTTYSGIGRAELRATQGDIIKKSLTYVTSIKESLEGVPSPLPPEPSESWVNAVIEKANEVLNSRVESFNINEQGHLIATLEDGTTQDLGSVVGSGGVSSVNGQTGDVILTANDVNAYSKSETNTKLSEKQNVIDSNNKLPYNLISGTPNIPTKTSDLTNDSGFITNAVNNLVNYYLKTDTYTKTEVNTALGNKENISNKVTSLSAQSTDTQYPSAKCVYDNLKSKQNALTAGNNITISNGTISADVPVKSITNMGTSFIPDNNGNVDTTIRKTSLDNVLVTNANYDLGSTEQASVTLTLPTPSGTDNYSCNEIYVAFKSGSTATTLSIVGTYVGDTSYLPSANSICELSFKYVCGTWVLVAKNTVLPST